MLGTPLRPLDQKFTLHSKPGASNVTFLNTEPGIGGRFQPEHAMRFQLPRCSTLKDRRQYVFIGFKGDCCIMTIRLRNVRSYLLLVTALLCLSPLIFGACGSRKRGSGSAPELKFQAIVKKDFRKLAVSGNYVFAAGHGGVLVSSNGGETWTSKTINDGLASHYINDITAAEGKVFAATPEGLCISSDDGNTWKVITTLDGLADNHILSVSATRDNVYAATARGLSISSDGGKTWVTKTTSSGLAGDVVTSVFSSGEMVYVGTDYHGISISADGGKTWRAQTQKNVPTQQIIQVYGAGGTIYALSPNRLFISRDAGSTWIEAQVILSKVESVAASGNAIYIGTQFDLNVSTDNGISWKKIDQDSGLGRDFVYGVTTAGSKVYVSHGEGYSISENEGSTWTTHFPPNELSGKEVQCVAAADGKIFAGTNGGLSASSDGGKTWIRPEGSLAEWGGVTAIAVHEKSVIYSDNRYYYVSKDGGKTFAQGSNFDLGAAKDFAVSNGDIFFTGSANLYVSSDGGTSWSRNGALNLPGDSTSLYVFNETIYIGTLNGIAISRDRGKTWTYKKRVDGLPVDAVSSISGIADTIFIGSSSGLYVSKDGGKSWTKPISDKVDHLRSSGNTVYAAIDRSLYISSNGGSEWKKVSRAAGISEVKYLFVSGTEIYTGNSLGLSISR